MVILKHFYTKASALKNTFMIFIDGYSRGPRASFETVWASHQEGFKFVDFFQEHIWLRTISDLREIRKPLVHHLSGNAWRSPKDTRTLGIHSLHVLFRDQVPNINLISRNM